MSDLENELVEFKLNARVLIKASGHPWFGFSGILKDEKLSTGQYVVELDIGQNAGVFLDEIKEL